MIEDEIDGPGLKVASARFVSWLSFAVNAVLWILIAYAYLTTIITIQSWWPGQSIPLHYRVIPQIIMQFGLAWSPRWLGRPIVDRLLRRRGLVRPPAPKAAGWLAGVAEPGRTTTAETWTRDPAVAPGAAAGEPVEVPFNLDAYILGGLAIWGLAAVGTPFVISGWRDSPGDAAFFLMLWFGVVVAGLPMLALIWGAVLSGKFVAATRVDAEGVRAYPRRLAVRRRFIPWSAVAACRVETDRDARGRVLALRPTLLGPGGEPLLQVALPDASVVDQERLVRAILARFPEATGPAHVIA